MALTRLFLVATIAMLAACSATADPRDAAASFVQAFNTGSTQDVRTMTTGLTADQVTALEGAMERCQLDAGSIEIVAGGVADHARIMVVRGRCGSEERALTVNTYLADEQHTWTVDAHNLPGGSQPPLAPPANAPADLRRLTPLTNYRFVDRGMMVG